LFYTGGFHFQGFPQASATHAPPGKKRNNARIPESGRHYFVMKMAGIINFHAELAGARHDWFVSRRDFVSDTRVAGGNAGNVK
jgi:hypothetical protein